MSTGATDLWLGCHGVAVRCDEDLGLGRCQGPPLAEAAVDFGPVAPAGVTMWTLAPDPAGGSSSQSAAAGVPRLARHADGSTVIDLDGRRLAIAPGGEAITITPPLDPIQVQLLASFAMPILLDPGVALVVHGAAAARDGRAIVVVGHGGAGKSSALVGLVEAGWAALSEDVCTIELAPAPRVWPGPPWVRRAHGEPGPRGARVAFATSQKTAWDLAPWQASHPVRLAQLVILDPPGGRGSEVSSLNGAAALQVLASHAVWLGDPAERGRKLFHPVASVVSTVPASRLRIARRSDWLALFVSATADLAG